MKYIEVLQINNGVEVYRVLKNDTVMVTKRCRIGKNGYVRPSFLREINVLKCLSNPPTYLENHPGRKNIIKLYDVYEEEGYLHFDMENATGNLFHLGEQMNLLTIKEKILTDVSDGLQYLHAFGFNHLDINLKNIVYADDPTNNQLRFMLIDFGNSMHVHRMNTYATPTYYTMSYELTLMSKFNDSKMFFHRKSDIWSLGIISYLLHTDRLLTDGLSLENQYQTLEDLLKNSKNNIYIPIDKNIGNRDIINKTNLMLIIDPHYRPIIYFSKIVKLNNPNNPNNSNNSINSMSMDDHLIKFINKNKSMKINNIFITSPIIIDNLKIIMKWLLEHMYGNNVNSVSDIIQSIDVKLGSNYVEKAANLKIICRNILEKIDYNFDQI